MSLLRSATSNTTTLSMHISQSIRTRACTLLHIDGSALHATRAFATSLRSHNSNNNSSNSRTGSQTPSSKTNLDPDKIKGPGGLTMTQIGKLVQQSRARDLEHQAKKQHQQQSSSKGSKQ
ncbi:hypothetical protein BGZ51_002995 [Haplosporangium sp. Z 767]|nr:hypothetical protein BGZ51_002995 [Haplosporangium sp. Z 767]KAF9192093.1 hypothetical protein BGZ50_008823 [Haplosporangium sp. Z 11]